MATANESEQLHSRWRCPACEGGAFDVHFRGAAKVPLHARLMAPSSDRFGMTAGAVHRCVRCGHACLAHPPESEVFEGAYNAAADVVSLSEEEGQVATALRDLDRIAQWAPRGRLLDVGCWTGSFLVAAQRSGWVAEGLEPSSWACDRATARGCTVRRGALDKVELHPNTYRVIAAADVIEHLLDPAGALISLWEALEDRGILFLTVPDAGSVVARVLGHRWWSVLPMHVQYFTRTSMLMLLARTGFGTESIYTHAKAFSIGYYVDRLAAFAPPTRRLVPTVARRGGIADRIIAPDLRDRMAIVARKLSARDV